MSSSTTSTERHAQPRQGTRGRLSGVHLTGAPRRVHRVLAGVRIVALLMAIVAFFLPFHVVHPSLVNWGDVFCWAPDCHLGQPAAAQSYGPEYTCTGWSHATSALPLLLLGALLFVSVSPFRRLRFGAAMLLAVLDVLVLGLLCYALFDLQHLFDHVVPLVAERVFSRTMSVVAVLVVADVLVTPVLYLWARSRLLRDR